MVSSKINKISHTHHLFNIIVHSIETDNVFYQEKNNEKLI